MASYLYNKLLRCTFLVIAVVLAGCQQSGFTQVTDPPQVATLSASLVTSTSCTLNSEVNPNGYSTTAFFEWGTDPNFGNSTDTASLGDGAQSTPLSQPITSLSPHTTYYYRVVAENQGRTVYGDAQQCTTLNPDTDHDGLSDGDEVNVYHTNPNDSDTDKDGLTDGEEVNQYHTDPLKADTDGDGLSDGDEVNVYHTDPLKADTDGDGLSDGDEVNSYHSDPLNVDTDGDGLSDGDEVNHYGTNPLSADSDGDGLSDSSEIELSHTDPLRVDTDGDGLSDGDELNTYHSDPLKADTDGDGLSDGEEVNTHHTDPLKSDTDGDGLSDSDEINTHHTDPLNADSDGDGLSDGSEVATYHTDPLNADTDGDGLGDGAEVNTYHSDPLKVDTDGDGLNDGDEVNNHHTDPLVVDTDGDGVGDGIEVSLGSDPLDPTSTPADLSVSFINGPSTAQSGQSITISTTIQNSGGISVNNVTVDVYLSVNSVVPDGDDIFLGSYSLASLAAHHSDTVNSAYTIPSAVALGNYHLGAIVDGGNTVPESNETNNNLALADVITVVQGLDSGDQTDGALSLTTGTFNMLIQSSDDVLGNGGDGNPHQPDGYATTLTANADAGAKQLAVASTAGFVNGDEVLIIQMSHTSNHGVYESIKNVTVADGTTLIFSTSLANNYDIASNSSVDRVQVVRVPHYSTVTISAGATLTTNAYQHGSGMGGVLAFRAATLTVDGSLNVDGLGYEGGAQVTVNSSYGQQGRSYTGVAGANKITANGGGGGGGYLGSTYGAAGGGYGTSASNCYYSCIGGKSYGSGDLVRLYLGSGGGSGGTANVATSGYSGAGGAGGGIIYLASDSIIGSGVISAKGAGGQAYSAGSVGEPGGGGSGGSIRVQASSLDSSLHIYVDGGVGGNASNALYNATNGGSGRKMVAVGSPDLVVTNVSAPTSTTRGSTISVSTTVKDQALDAASAPFRVGIYASLDPTITTDDAFLGDYSLSGLTGNSSVMTATNVTIPSTIYADTPAGYQYRKKISIHPVNGSGTTTLKDFPVLIDLTDPDLRTLANGGKLQNGLDIVFTDALGAALHYEIEERSDLTGHFRAWVRVPQMVGGIDTNIYLYYGNASVSTSPADTAGTWDANFKTVLHEDEVPGASKQSDSTINANDTSNNNMAGAGNSIDAVVGKGVSFDGVDDYEKTTVSPVDTGNSDWTIEVWVKLDSLNSIWNSIVESADYPTGQRLLYVDSADGKLYSDTGIQVYGPGQGLTLGTWNQVVLVHDRINDLSKWYINGAWVATSKNVHVVANNASWFFGIGKDASSGAINGALDEIRISDAQRSPEWIRAEYENILSPSTFYSVGAEEAYGSFSSQPPFYIGAIVNYSGSIVESNEFNDAATASQTTIINP